MWSKSSFYPRLLDYCSHLICGIIIKFCFTSISSSMTNWKVYKGTSQDGFLVTNSNMLNVWSTLNWLDGVAFSLGVPKFITNSYLSLLLVCQKLNLISIWLFHTRSSNNLKISKPFSRKAFWNIPFGGIT